MAGFGLQIQKELRGLRLGVKLACEENMPPHDDL